MQIKIEPTHSQTHSFTLAPKVDIKIRTKNKLSI